MSYLLYYIINIYTQILCGFLLLKNMEKCCLNHMDKTDILIWTKRIFLIELSGANSILFLIKIFQILKIVF